MEAVRLFAEKKSTPLADRLRPQSVADILGQDHLLQKAGSIGGLLSQKKLVSMILWGPPGCGKTTLARLLAQETDLYFEPISAIFSGVADLKKIFAAARARRETGQGTLLFVDEIHRFNKSQQDSFLPFVEDGSVVLIGATTENPSFELNAALLSRMQVFVLKRLDETALTALLARAEDLVGDLVLTDEARTMMINMADGDGRFLLNMVEMISSLGAPDQPLTPDDLTNLMQKRPALYDKAGDEHYNLISALHKSLRASDVDAALYWFARMLEGGEDPRYIARRLTRFAVEDIALADPQALHQAVDAWQAYERLGSPEGELALAQLVVYLGTAPKSNASYVAYKQARAAAKKTGSLMPPKHILNAPTNMMKDLGYGKDYQYDHDNVDAFSGQNCFPDDMKRVQFYQPVERGFEREILKRLAYWNKKRQDKK